MKMKSLRKIKQILQNLDYKLLNGIIDDGEINKVVYDSRIVDNDDL